MSNEPLEMTMFRYGVWAAVVGVVLIAASQEAKAGIGFQPVSQEELKMTSEAQAAGAPAIILYRQVDRDDNIHTPHEDNYLRIKILSEEGRKYADVEIPFVKQNEDIVSIHARTIRPDGSTADFGGNVFEKVVLKGKSWGRQYKVLVKAFTLTDVQVGSILEFSYTRDFQEYSLWDSRWFLSEELFTKKARFSLKPFLGDSNVDFSVRWVWNYLPEGAKAPEYGAADHIVRLEANNIPAFETEDYMAPENELKSRIDFIYTESLTYDKDPTVFWKRIAKEWKGKSDGVVNKRGGMEQALAQIIAPSDPPEVKLRKIYDKVQTLRNTSYEEEKTEQELRRRKEKPADKANVEQIWKRGYGDGRQLTRLFLGLARAAGFDASECWVATRNQYFFNSASMQSEELNEDVVLVKLNGKDLYLDPGGMFTPFGLLMWPETGVPGLKLDKEGGTWIQTPLPEASESRVTRVGKFKLTENGDLEGKVSVTYTGLEAMDHRMEQRHADDIERKKYLEERLASQIAAAGQIELTNKPDWKSSNTPLVAEFDVKIPGWTSSAGRRATIPAAVFTAAEKGLFEHANRAHPIYFDYPHMSVDDITIGLPTGWQVSSIPPAKVQDAHVITYDMKVEKNAEVLHLTRKLTIDALSLEQKYYAALRNFFQGIRTADSEQIVLQPGEIHASN
ncbi:MAG: DUF3857 domain-containing protein [Terriglobales bacterium]